MASLNKIDLRGLVSCAAVAAACITPGAFAQSAAAAQLLVTTESSSPRTPALQAFAKAFERHLGRAVSLTFKRNDQGILAVLETAGAAPIDGTLFLIADLNLAILSKIPNSSHDISNFHMVDVIAERPLIIIGDPKSPDIDALKSYIGQRGDRIQLADLGPNSLSGVCMKLLLEKLGIKHRISVIAYGNVDALAKSFTGANPNDLACVEAEPSVLNTGKIIGITVAWPVKELAQVPVLSNYGLPLTIVSNLALFMPPGTPTPLIQQAKRAMQHALREPAVKSALAEQLYIIPK